MQSPHIFSFYSSVILLHPNNPSLQGQDNDICGEQELCEAEGGHIISDPGGWSHGQCQEAHAMWDVNKLSGECQEWRDAALISK